MFILVLGSAETPVLPAPVYKCVELYLHSPIRLHAVVLEERCCLNFSAVYDRKWRELKICYGKIELNFEAEARLNI
jgi:hypothetical protein